MGDEEQKREEVKEEKIEKNVSYSKDLSGQLARAWAKRPDLRMVEHSEFELHHKVGADML